MASREQRPDVAVFIDFENVYVSVRDKLDANPNFEMIMDRCEDLGRVVIARAYADWYRYPRVTSALYANGVEPMYVPTYYYDRDLGRTGRAIKNSVDMNLCIDAMKTLYTNPNIEKFVLCTGDRDFIPLVNSIRQQGKEVIIIGIGGAASSHLAQSADEFIFYETLVGKKPVDLQNDQPKARMPEKVREPDPDTQSNGRDFSPAPREPASVREPQQEDIYSVLVRAIHLARERDFVCSFGSLKLLMKELMGGEFREDKYRDASGKPFAKFKDFVMEAERRGKVLVFTSGAMNEVFLPGEDPYKLSRFAIDLKEEPVAASPVVTPEETLLKDRPSVSNRRRRRRSRTRTQDEVAQLITTNGTPDVKADDFDGGFAEIQEEDAPVDASEERFEDLLERLGEEQAHGEELEERLFPELAPETDSTDEASEPQSDDAFALATQELTGDQASEYNADLSAEPQQNETAIVLMSDQNDMPFPEQASGPVAPESSELINPNFSEEEWQTLKDTLLRTTRPLSFMQIHDLLRGERNNAGLQRTNEELRTMIKQAINTGILTRSGKGSRVAYRLAQPDDSLEASEPSLLEDIEQDMGQEEGADQSIAEYTQPPEQVESNEAAPDSPSAEQGEQQTEEPFRPIEANETPAIETEAVSSDTSVSELMDSGAPVPVSKASRSRRKKSSKAANEVPASEPVAEIGPTEEAKAARRRRPSKKDEEKTSS